MSPREITVLLGDPRLPDETKVGRRFSPEDVDAVERLKSALASLTGYRFDYLDDHVALVETLRERPPPFVLNFCDTGYMNDARRELHVPALLELCGIPYSGSGPACLGLCYDKSMVRAIARDHGLPVPAELYIGPDDGIGELDVPFPALVKPATGDGSVGITADSVVDDPDGARAAIARLRRDWPGRAVLIQQFLAGTELAVGLVGNPGAGWQVLTPLEVDYSGLPDGLPPILSYESKTVPDSPYWTELRYRPATVSAEVRDAVATAAKTLFAVLGCRDYARFDFRLDTDGVPRLLEANPNPAWCWDGKMNLMAGFEGMGYAGFLELIIGAALERAWSE